MRFVKIKEKPLASNLVLIYFWTNIDHLPHCGLYYNDKLISDVYWEYQSANLEDIARFLENAEPAQLRPSFTYCPERI